VESIPAADRAYFWLPVTETRECWPRDSSASRLLGFCGAGPKSHGKLTDIENEIKGTCDIQT
jgi:hypothetical protein